MENKKKIGAFVHVEGKSLTHIEEIINHYQENGIEEFFFYYYGKDTAEKEKYIQLLRELKKVLKLPFLAGICPSKLEDVKKTLYTGAEAVVMPCASFIETSIGKEAVKRFGNKKILVEEDYKKINPDRLMEIKRQGVYGIVLKQVELSETFREFCRMADISLFIWDSLQKNNLEELMKIPQVKTVYTDYFEDKNISSAKELLKNAGILIEEPVSALPFTQLKRNDQGLIPVVTQDYQTGEVLMMAYMNQEAYEETLTSRNMVYFSRSRQKLWRKGETSGHYQFVKSLAVDCDRDTLLAKVEQIGAACHTGHHSCFFTDIIKEKKEEKGEFAVLEEIYQTIAERKSHPKEGSYTSYLFQEGMDKILKKCGEEATEIVIAAKNPEQEELKYEMADYLYHLMVLMVECGLQWEDILIELLHRR